jgi:hypothetical protein
VRLPFNDFRNVEDAYGDPGDCPCCDSKDWGAGVCHDAEGGRGADKRNRGYCIFHAEGTESRYRAPALVVRRFDYFRLLRFNGAIAVMTLALALVDVGVVAMIGAPPTRQGSKLSSFQHSQRHTTCISQDRILEAPTRNSHSPSWGCVYWSIARGTLARPFPSIVPRATLLGRGLVE